MMRIIGRIASRLSPPKARENQSERPRGPLTRMLEDDVNNLNCLTRALAAGGRYNPEREPVTGARRGAPAEMMSGWFSGDPMLAANLANPSQENLDLALASSRNSWDCDPRPARTSEGALRNGRPAYQSLLDRAVTRRRTPVRRR